MTRAGSTNPTDPVAGAPDVHRPADDKEEVYFNGSPLVRGELGQMILTVIIGLTLIAMPVIYYFLRGWWPVWWVTLLCIILGLLVLVIPYLLVKRTRYRITNYRIDFERGIFSKTVDTLELWHVDDIKFHQSFFDRLFGVGNITIMSNDKTTPQLNLRGLPRPRPLFDNLKQRVIAIKRQRGVIKMDIG